MPGYILHLTAAQMFLKTQKGQEFFKTKQDKNDFLIGNLLPVTIGNMIGGMVTLGLPLWYVNKEGK